MLWASSALALLVAMFAAAASSWPAALGAVAIAVLPLSKRTSQLRAARLAALFLVAFSAVAAAIHARLGLTAETSSLVLVASVALVRAWVLGRESAVVWASERVGALAEAPAEPSSLSEALWRALGAPSFAEGRADIERAICLLALAPSDAVPADEHARRAFWINVYNVLARHAVRRRRSTALYDWLEPFRTVYTVAGEQLTLDQIEHGLLRDNARPPVFPLRALRAGDPRLGWGVPLDPRIHFALRCGAVSCPPIRRYDADQLEGQLELAAAAFLAAESTFDAAAAVVVTSRILSFYAADFGGRASVLEMIAGALGNRAVAAPNVRVEFRPYDFTWSHR